MPDFDTAIVGSGVVGLAIARSLAMAGHDVLVLEQHDAIGLETSSRNSEVIHAGIYYPQGSLKARLCVDGKHRLYDFCKTHHVPFKRLGKLIVATTYPQLSTLDAIERHAANNGVDDLRLLDKSAMAQLEPSLAGEAALHSPSTGIIDSHAYMLALLGEAEDHGAQIAFNCRVKRIEPITYGGYQVLIDGDEELTCSARNVIISSGLHTTDLLRASPLELSLQIPATLFAKGNYFQLAARAPFSRLIYPVPEPGGLGVHLTLDMNGNARFGPDVEWVETLQYEVNPQRSKKFYDAIRTYWPDLPDRSLNPDYAGIRPKISSPDEPNADFIISRPTEHGLEGLVILQGIESPGLTASLAIADTVRREISTTS